jgi:hypothetical protein
MSDGKDLPDDGNGNDDGGDNDDDGDDNNQAINSPDTAGTIELQYHAADNAAGGGGDNDDDDDEGVPRKTLVTATIRRKTDAANADFPEGGVLNGRTTKVGQYSSITFEASAPPRSGCS